MNNIILIGMPGCGKSTLGVILAKTLGYDFIDSDLIIQKNEGKKLYEIIAQKGLEAFMECESKAILSIKAENTVIATGGSAVLCADAMSYLKSIGKVVYIDLSPDVIEKRINNINTRGIVMSKGETLLDIYNQRSPLYEFYSDITIKACEDNIERNIEKIINMI
ncbi:MAG: shikimate kinase [Clostridia bacterium]|nr:shikimate kinase [Clostridia bacterium]